MLHSNDVQKLVDSVKEEEAVLRQKNIDPILFVDYRIRKPLAKLLEPFDIKSNILGNAEIDPHAKFEVVGTINIDFKDA